MRIAKLALSLLLVGLSSAHPQYPSGGGDQGTGVVGPVDTGCPAYSHDCVPHYQCRNGVIITDGGGLIDVRIKPKSQCTNPEYASETTICCRIPGKIVQTCPPVLVCVEEGQCNQIGTVDTVGAEYIGSSCYVTPGAQVIGVCCPAPPLDVCYDNKVCLTQGQCAAGTAVQGTAAPPYDACFIDKANYVTGVCCQPPPLDFCLGGEVCLIEDQCAAGTAVQGALPPTYDACFIDKANYVTGVCCQPPPLDFCLGSEVCLTQDLCAVGTAVQGAVAPTYDVCFIDKANYLTGVCCQPPPLDVCPGNQWCLTQGECATGTAVQGAGAATYDTCFIDKANYVTGICCDPPIIVCPGDSVCLPESLCQGDILDNGNNFVPYGNTGTWSQCAISSDIVGPGVCCLTPYKTADHCGARNYGLGVQNQETLNDNVAEFGEFPWQAIISFSNYTFKCGASLVADQWLVTGAHCVSGYQYGDFRIRLGEWRVDTYDEPLPYVEVDISKINIHPLFNSSNLHNDVAVIKLVSPVKFDYHINTVCLPAPGQYPLPGTRCFASGWGKDAFLDGAYQAILKRIDVPFVDHEYCQNLLRKTRLGKYYLLDKSFVCAGGEEYQDVCVGDGGGPLVCEDPATGFYVLQGITAWGIGCGQKDVPGVYVDVHYFADWISNIIYGTPVAEVTAPHSPYGRK